MLIPKPIRPMKPLRMRRLPHERAIRAGVHWHVVRPPAQLDRVHRILRRLWEGDVAADDGNRLDTHVRRT